MKTKALQLTVCQRPARTHILSASLPVRFANAVQLYSAHQFFRPDAGHSNTYKRQKTSDEGDNAFRVRGILGGIIGLVASLGHSIANDDGSDTLIQRWKEAPATYPMMVTIAQETKNVSVIHQDGIRLLTAEHHTSTEDDHPTPCFPLFRTIHPRPSRLLFRQLARHHPCVSSFRVEIHIWRLVVVCLRETLPMHALFIGMNPSRPMAWCASRPNRPSTLPVIRLG